VKTPTTIKIGSQTFSIIERNRGKDSSLSEESVGYTLDRENIIVLDDSLPLSKKRVTLLHEILHAIRMVYDTSVTPKKADSFETWEHYFIGIYEEGVLTFMQDNPEVVSYLTGKVTKA
jgi:hypothetical protein